MTADTPSPTPETTTELDIEEGRRLLAAMTPAPWEYASGTITNWHDQTFDMEWMPNRRGPNEQADGAGMVWLRNNADALFRRIRELEAALAESSGPLREENERLREENAAYAKAELRSLMSEASEETWFATWLNDCEFDLWAAAVGDIERFADEAPRLLKLAEACGGWWTYEEFVPLAGWRERYAAYWPKRLAACEEAKRQAEARGEMFVRDGSGVRLVKKSEWEASSAGVLGGGAGIKKGDGE